MVEPIATIEGYCSPEGPLMGEGSRPPHHTLIDGASARADARLRPSHREGRIVERGRRRGSRTGHGRGAVSYTHLDVYKRQQYE